MAKYLILALVVYLVFRLLRRPAAPPSMTKESSDPQVMVKCAACGVHLPRGEALGDRGNFFCCEAHRLTGSKTQE